MTRRLETSHGVERPTVRSDEVPPLPRTDETDPDRDPRTGRFRPSNGAARARRLKAVARERQMLGLDPSKVAPWMAPLVAHAQEYAAQLSSMVPQTPALGALAADAAVAEAVFRGLLSIGAAGDFDALKEARGWLREHRQALVTLAALAGDVGKRSTDLPLGYELVDGSEATPQ